MKITKMVKTIRIELLSTRAKRDKVFPQLQLLKQI